MYTSTSSSPSFSQAAIRFANSDPFSIRNSSSISFFFFFNSFSLREPIILRSGPPFLVPAAILDGQVRNNAYFLYHIPYSLSFEKLPAYRIPGPTCRRDKIRYLLIHLFTPGPVPPYRPRSCQSTGPKVSFVSSRLEIVCWPGIHMRRFVFFFFRLEIGMGWRRV